MKILFQKLQEYLNEYFIAGSYNVVQRRAGGFFNSDSDF
jgi:hypothetical protein